MPIISALERGASETGRFSQPNCEPSENASKPCRTLAGYSGSSPVKGGGRFGFGKRSTHRAGRAGSPSNLARIRYSPGGSWSITITVSGLSGNGNAALISANDRLARVSRVNGLSGTMCSTLYQNPVEGRSALTRHHAAPRCRSARGGCMKTPPHPTVELLARIAATSALFGTRAHADVEGRFSRCTPAMAHERDGETIQAPAGTLAAKVRNTSPEIRLWQMWIRAFIVHRSRSFSLPFGPWL